MVNIIILNLSLIYSIHIFILYIDIHNIISCKLGQLSTKQL